MIKNKKLIYKTHGLSYLKEYDIWKAIKQRCFNKKNPAYKNYGGRGIEICNRWKNSFENFYKDMGKRPDGMSIDRIDNNKGYYKENCRWATRKEQANNRRIALSDPLYKYNGKKRTLAEISRITNINQTTLWMRINKYNWSQKRAFYG